MKWLAVVAIPPDEAVESCRDSIAESIVDVHILLFWQIFSARTALFSCPFA